MSVRNIALVLGIIYLIVGIAGFIPGLVTGFEPVEGGAEGAPETVEVMPHGRLLGLFPINLLLNIVHLAVGVWGIASFRSADGSVAFCRGLTILYGVLAILGLIPGLNTLFGLVPLYGHNVWLHAVTALITAYFGWGPPSRIAPRVVTTSTRTP